MTQSILACFLGVWFLLLLACGTPSGNSVATRSNVNFNGNITNSPGNISNPSGSDANSVRPLTELAEAGEPSRYQAKIELSLTANSDEQKASLPTLVADVARKEEDRRMEFTLPNGEKVVYLDTETSNYLILPNRRQFAELNKESVGFDIRRLMMPGQIVDQLKRLQGVKRTGEEMFSGRKVVRYTLTGEANTQTQAGKVGTDSFFLIDRDTGLPLRSETTIQSENGGSVQGYKGLRMVTNITDLKMDPAPNLFVVPNDYSKVDAEQVKAQLTLVFNALSALIGQTMHSTSPAASPSVVR